MIFENRSIKERSLKTRKFHHQILVIESCVLNLYTLEVEGSATVECSGKGSTIGEGLELAEPPSSSHNHDVSMENHEVAETREDEALVTDPTTAAEKIPTSTSEGLVVVHTGVSGVLQLVQLWAFEHFPLLGVKNPRPLEPGEPRAARWHKVNPVFDLGHVRFLLNVSTAESFRWCTYAVDLENWRHFFILQGE